MFVLIKEGVSQLDSSPANLLVESGQRKFMPKRGENIPGEKRKCNESQTLFYTTQMTSTGLWLVSGFVVKDTPLMPFIIQGFFMLQLHELTT